MAESSEKKSNDLPIPAIASIVLTLAAVLAHQLNPLDSPRPIIPNGKNAEYVNIQDVNARLWQDPFGAISQHDVSDGKSEANKKKIDCTSSSLIIKGDEKCKHTFHALVDSIGNMSQKKTLGITVLGIMVSGGSYAENVENRRRTRYAVLSGLAVKNYAPNDYEHIGYVENLGLERPKDEYMINMPKKIPFEWFKADKNNGKDNKDKKPAVLVLWLDDTAFASTDHPLDLLGKFVNLIQQQTKIPVKTTIWNSKADSKAKKANLTFKFLGPATSDTLQKIIDEIASRNNEKGFCRVDKNKEKSECDFEFYNAVATGDWPGINIPYGKELEQKRTILTYLQSLKSPLLFTRTSLTDYELAETMVNELKLRGFEKEKISLSSSSSSEKNNGHIVIISEWDTIYGRLGLPEAMKCLLLISPDKKTCEGNTDKSTDVNWIHSFNYMRGLDGILPGEEKKPDEAKGNKDDYKNNNAENSLERSEGQGQQDYLRRLATHLYELNQELKSAGKGEIKAIGVLGSDAYDKLMILKALRPIFTGTIFFTTDLDTRLMHPNEFDITRNLIVASSFDLTLAKTLQKSIPPFRDSYQTANFFATQIAVDDANGKKLSQSIINKMLGEGKARLFEIGHNKAIALNYDNNQSCKTLDNCENAHSYPVQKNKKLVYLLALSLPIVIWIIPFLYFLNRYCILEKSWVIPKQMTCFFAIGIAMFLWVYYKIYFVIHNEITFVNNGEPFFLNEGISIWPSEIIRLFAGILGYLFLANTITAVILNNKNTETKFGLTSPSSSGNIAELWKDYHDKISSPLCIILVVFYSVLFMVVGFILMEIFGYPFVPFRGEASKLADILVLKCFSVPIFLVLAMTVSVITWHSKKLITRLGKCESVWPDEALIHYDLAHEKSHANKELFILRKELGKKYHLDELLDIKFIAAHTKVIGNLVYYPLIILALMIFARSKIFDNWDMPMGLLIVFLSATLITLGNAFYLRHVAEQARKETIKKISGMKMVLACQPNPDIPACKTMEKQIDLALAEIHEINEGAFRTFANEPAFQALLIPFGGYSLVALIENLVLSGF